MVYDLSATVRRRPPGVIVWECPKCHATLEADRGYTWLPCMKCYRPGVALPGMVARDTVRPLPASWAAAVLIGGLRKYAQNRRRLCAYTRTRRLTVHREAMKLRTTRSSGAPIMWQLLRGCSREDMIRHLKRGGWTMPELHAALHSDLHYYEGQRQWAWPTGPKPSLEDYDRRPTSVWVGRRRVRLG